MFKLAVIIMGLLVTTSAFAQDHFGSGLEEGRPITTADVRFGSGLENQEWTLGGFIALWKSVASEIEKQDKEFCAEVDETATAIEKSKGEIRRTLSDAGKEFRARHIEQFISLMNQAEIKIKALRREYGFSTTSETRAYNRLLSIAAGQYSSYQPGTEKMAQTQAWVPDTL
jgi:hypothetical protein